MQENDVTQGGVLSCTLFIVKMNSLRNVVPPTISHSTYVADVQTSFKSCNMSLCECQVQLGVKKLASLADNDGFKLNSEKKVLVLGFLESVGSIRTQTLITLNGVSISVRKERVFRYGIG